ncbi:hypothetical protein SARC_06053 [Sphaeroforma arctica JP610]|uniref:OsmC-like protein n=1 Tax=Sphaeroforma arctica JP610 TaxID=667725 RepID=A0A0L0FXS8_9EUKA|nr:hypothetical protein SARC_06053 [Sphaeroforma arctica JP610]KNC81630.1 hypothetical protein SARC_06053 [Sphaeroforma arctica JP610]|eukprot:XP_014155532.1 hypothetical protein SARC_06053 [Sphaeroforma arctica JP610]
MARTLVTQAFRLSIGLPSTPWNHTRYSVFTRLSAAQAHSGRTLTSCAHTPSNNETDEFTRHSKHYTVRAIGRKSACEITCNTGHTLATDVPKTMGGSDAAPQPVEHLLAALCGCAQATATFVSRMMTPRVAIDRIEFNVRATRDSRGALQLPIDAVPDVPSRLHTVEGTATVVMAQGKAMTARQLQIFGTQVEARCPVANMLQASGCRLRFEWVAESA